MNVDLTRGPPQIPSKTRLDELIGDLVKLCDGIEKAGLVDYEKGIWEEEILTGTCSTLTPLV